VLPAGLSALTNVQTLELSWCKTLTALPAGLTALTNLQHLNLDGCSALHTPPPHVVRAGFGAVLQFLRDLGKGDAASHLAKLVLLGDQTAGKSSLADSLALGRPAPRAARDRTVGIEVGRWRVGGGSPLVVNVYDAAGHHVYRATHGLFMSEGALFLHVVRSDAAEDEAAGALLEWAEAVQQEAPGAAMGVVWTHADCFSDYACPGAGWCQGFVRAEGGSSRHGGAAATAAGGEGDEQWAAAWCRQQRGAPCALEGVGVVAVPSGLRWRCVGADKPAAGNELSNAKLAGALNGKTAFTPQEWAAFGIKFLNRNAFIKAGDAYFQPLGLAGQDSDAPEGGDAAGAGAGEESVGGKVAVLDCRLHWQDQHINNDIQDAIPALTRQGAAGVIVIVSVGPEPRFLDQISAAPPFPLMIMPESEAHVLTATGASIDVFLGAWQSPCCRKRAFQVQLRQAREALSGSERSAWACGACAVGHALARMPARSCVHALCAESWSLMSICMLLIRRRRQECASCGSAGAGARAGGREH
jgi:hypothetical protein